MHRKYIHGEMYRNVFDVVKVWEDERVERGDYPPMNGSGIIWDFFLKEEYCGYGSDMINDELHKRGLPVNKRKTHRLMDEISLLTSVTRVP